jgi:hypothetical protein
MQSRDDRGQWRIRFLDQAKRQAEEALLIGKEVASVADIHVAEIVLARIDAVEARTVASRDRLLGILATATEDQQCAEPHYWLWKLALDPTTDHRDEAERLYADLYSRIARHEYKLKLDELRAAAPTATPCPAPTATSSTTPTEVRDAVTE